MFLSILLLVLIFPILMITIYFGVPGILVKLFPGRFTKIDPNHAKLVQRGGKIVRVLIGSNFKIRGDNLLDVNAFWVYPTNPNDPEDDGGGRLDTIVTALEEWVFAITGNRVVGATFPDLWSAELVKYDLKRPLELRNSNKGKQDISDHIILSPQIYPFEVKDAETGKMIETEIENKKYSTRSRVSATLSGKYTFQIRNLWLATYGTNFEYFPFILSTLNAEVRGQIVQIGLDDLFSDQIKEDVATRVIQASGVDVPEGQPVPAAEGNDFGTILRYGFKYLQLIVEDVEIDKAFSEQLAANQKAILNMQAKISESEMDITVAGNQKTAMEIRAKGKTAEDHERLTAVAKGAQKVLEVTSNAGLMRDIVVADRYAKGVETAKNGQIIISTTGSGPVPTLDLTPKSNTGEPE